MGALGDWMEMSKRQLPGTKNAKETVGVGFGGGADRLGMH